MKSSLRCVRSRSFPRMTEPAKGRLCRYSPVDEVSKRDHGGVGGFRDPRRDGGPVDFRHRLGCRELSARWQYAKRRSEAQAQKIRPADLFRALQTSRGFAGRIALLA